MSSKRYLRLATILFFSASVLCQTIDGSNNDFPDEGPPASYFSAAPTMPVAALQSAASRLGRASHEGSFRGAAVVWTADMDVDCDGIDYGCKGNLDGRPETSWGALSAYEVPFIVIPEGYLDMHEADLPGNNIAAVICNGNMFYGILGDTNGDSPEVTGEASWLMARTCFPTEDLSGATGHDDPDVTYIVFLGEEAVLPASAMDEKHITDFDTLREMGDALVNSLVKNIGLGSDDGMGTRTRFRRPLFKVVDASTGARRTASILTARSWNTTSRLPEPSTASSSSASGSSVTPSPPIASASTRVTSSPSASSSSAANSSSSGAASTNHAAVNSAGGSTSPSNTTPSVATSSSGPRGAAASIGTAPNNSASSIPFPSTPAASVTAPSAIASSSIPSSLSAAASNAASRSSSAARKYSTPAGFSASVPTPLSVPPSQAASNTVIPGAGSTPSASLHAGAASPSAASSSSAAASNPAAPPRAATSATAAFSAPSSPTPTPSCSWPGHCLGAPCSTLDDCSNDLVCVNGLCAVDQDLVLGSISSPTGTPAVRRWITAVRGDVVW